MAGTLWIGEAARRAGGSVTRCGRRLAPAVALLAVLCLGGVTRAEILGADLRVDGLVCPFCAFGIEKKLLDVDGVTSVDVRLDEGRLALRLEPGNTAKTAALEAAVEKAGFELAGLAIEVRGTLATEADETWLEAGTGQRFLLREAETDGDGDSAGERPLSSATRARLSADDRGRVLVSGRVLGGTDAPRIVVDPPSPPAGRAP